MQYREQMETFFAPLQFGVGISQGAEVVVHATRVMMDQHPDWVVFKTDFRNAFVCRAKALEVVRQEFPQLLPWLQSIYSERSHLWMQSDAGLGGGARDFIWSEDGAQQGDPLGPFLFCVAMQQVLVQANAVLSAAGGFALGDMDDITGSGPVEVVADVLKVIGDAAAEIGLELQLQKCSVFCPRGDPVPDIPADVERADGGLVVLGVPMGSREFVEDSLMEIVTDLETLVPKLVKMEDSQRAMVLLRMCFAQKFTFWLRTVETLAVQRAAIRFDQAVERCFCGVLRIEAALTREQWQQVVLETKHGGCGVACAAKTAAAAFVSSVVGCMKHLRRVLAHFGLREELDLEDLSATSHAPLVQRLREAHEMVVQKCHGVGEGEGDEEEDGAKVPTLAEMVEQPRSLQHKLSEKLGRALMKNLRRSLGKKDKQRLDSCGREGGAWVTCVPKTPEQHLMRADFRQRMLARLGMDLPGLIRMPCVCRGGPIIDAQGFHFTSQCPVGNQRFRTHDAIAGTWTAVMKQEGFLCRVEDPSCFREVEDTNKRADIVIDNWLDGRRGIFDVSVAHP
jgi:hypothetical protein